MPYTRTVADNTAFPHIQKAYQWDGVRYNLLAGSYATVFKNAFGYTRTGDKVPDYKEKIRLGLQAGSSYNLEASKLVNVSLCQGSVFALQDYTVTPPPARWNNYVYDSFEGLWMNPGLVDRSHIATSLAKAEATALRKTYSKIRSEYQHMSASSTVAEFVDVIRQFGKPFDAIVDLTNRRLNRLALEAKGLKGSTVFKRIKYAEIVASTYLEYAFGLAPLIKDTADLAEALARWQYENSGQARFRTKVVGRGIDEAADTQTTASTGVYPRRVVKTTIQKKTECRVQYVCGLRTAFQADFGSNDRLVQLLGFSPIDWIPAAWEAVPWSWLVDYFTNVGEILQAAATTQHNVTWITKTVTYRTVIKVASLMDVAASMKFQPTNVRCSQASNPDFGSYEIVRTTLTRTLPTSLGVPPLVIEHPFDSVKKMLNMAAVLIAKRPSSSALWLT